MGLCMIAQVERGMRKKRFRVMRLVEEKNNQMSPLLSNGDMGLVENVVVLTCKRRIVNRKGDEMVMDSIVERSMSNGDLAKVRF